MSEPSTNSPQAWSNSARSGSAAIFTNAECLSSSSHLIPLRSGAINGTSRIARTPLSRIDEMLTARALPLAVAEVRAGAGGCHDD